MAFSEHTLQRLRNYLEKKGLGFEEKYMFSGVCLMVDDKMLVATHVDKNTGEDMLMCRVGPAAYEEALAREGVTEMQFNGRNMKGYIYVSGSWFHEDADLHYWLDLCLAYNPLARASKKKK